MMQDTQTVGHRTGPHEGMSAQGLAALLALAGSRQLDVDGLRRRTRLSQRGFESLMAWLQREYLVDLVCTLDGERVKERLALTERGEAVLLALLERTCELPEFR